MSYSGALTAIKMADASKETRKNIALCLLGEPGIGKTTCVYDYAKEKGCKVVEIIASQILPNEVSGITMPVHETHSMEIYDHARLASLEDGDILLFDELLQASPSTLAACLTLIQERRLLSGKMLPDVLIVAAANPLASASQIPVSIRQRFMFYNYRFDKDEWMDHITEKFKLNRDSVQNLATFIKFEGTGYNVVTPRTIDKCLTWLDNTDGYGSSTFENVMDSIGVIFDDRFYSEALSRVFRDKPRNYYEEIIDSLKGVIEWNEKDYEAILNASSIDEAIDYLMNTKPDFHSVIADTLKNISITS